MKEKLLNGKTILITGIAGFIGASLAENLLENYKGIRLIGVDNLNEYYDINLKKDRLATLKKFSNFIFLKESIENKERMLSIFNAYSPQIVINLAAQAGVRYSIKNPDVYIDTNIVGFFNILEACRNNNIEHLIFASSSSVYGTNRNVPYDVSDKVDCPVSLYAATKRSNELLAYSYAKLFDIPSTGLRFFTVYGPWGRPDMAYFSFTNKMINGDDIEIFNYGRCKRDFTYIDDVVKGIISVMKKSPSKDENDVPYKLYNIGNNNPESLLDFIDILYNELYKADVLPENYNFDSHKKFVAMQPGDVEITYADISGMKKDFGFMPTTSLREGIKKFVEWYKQYYFLL